MSVWEDNGMTEEEFESLTSDEKEALSVPEDEVLGSRPEDQQPEESEPVVEEPKEEPKVEPKEEPVVEEPKVEPKEEVPVPTIDEADGLDIPFRRESYKPVYDVELSAEDQATLSELSERHDEGDLSSEEYFAQRDKINNQARDAYNAQNAAIHDWQQDQNEFFAKAENSIFRAEGPMRSALNGEVIRLAQDGGLDGLTVLQQAKESVMSLFKQQEPEVDPLKGKPKAKIPDTKTLGGLPAADRQSTGDSEFEQLDALEGLEREAQIARMTPEQIDRYERGL